MCISPSMLDFGPVACRLCWQCQKNRLNDYAGRCIAEQKNSSATFCATLTYGGGDNVHACTLVYADVQKMLKKLRKKYSVRYIVSGEYGSEKGRTHWHIALFFKGKSPKIVTDPLTRKPYEIILPRWKDDHRARISWGPWDHGFSYFQQADYGGFHYLLEYAIKDQTADVALSQISMSKKPPLGTQYFEELADHYIQSQLSPTDLSYTFPDVFDKKGKRRKFMLQGKVREIFLERFMRGYEEVNGCEYPWSELLLENEHLVCPPDQEWEQFMFQKLVASRAGKQNWADAQEHEEMQEMLDNTKHYNATLEGKPVGVSIDIHGRVTIYEREKVWRVPEVEAQELQLMGIEPRDTPPDHFQGFNGA